MKNSIFEKGAQGCVTTCPPFMYSNTANRSPFSDGPFIVASTRSPVEHVKSLDAQVEKEKIAW